MKPTVIEVAPMIRDLYSETVPCTMNTGAVGGHLHIVLDDYNVRTDCVAYCLEIAKNDGCSLCAAIAEQLLLMSRTQRLKLAKRRDL